MIIVPVQIRHNFVFDLELTLSNFDEKRCHRCAYCGEWVTEERKEELNKMFVCPKKDRRHNSRRKGKDRRNSASL
jgi:hypothetical protein